MRHNVTINVNHEGLGTITVDGHNLSGAVQATTINTHVDDATRVELDLVMLDVSTHAEGARVLIPEATRDALIALGWTPPAEEADS